MEKWSRTDGRFRVAIEPRSGGRPGLRVRSGFGRRAQVEKAARTEAEAVELAEAIWSHYLAGRITEPDVPPDTWGELVDRFVVRESLAPATRRTYKRALSLTRPTLGDRALSVLSRQDVATYVDGLTTCNTESRRSYLRTIRACVRWGLEKGWLRADVTEGVDVAGPRAPVRPWLDASLWPAFLEQGCVTRAARIRFGFVLETGLRLGELLAARWTWLHTTVGTPSIRVAPSEDFTPKWGQSRAVPLTRRAQALLDEARELWPGKTLIFQDDKRPLRDPKWARDVARACVRAGLPEVDLHGLRRSCGARWLQSGFPLHEVARLLGHQDVTTTMRWYGGIADSTLAARMATLDALDAAAGNVVALRRTP